MQSGQGWDRGPQGAAGAQIGCLTQIEGQGGFLEGEASELSLQMEIRVCPPHSDLGHVSLWSVRDAFRGKQQKTRPQWLKHAQVYFLVEQQQIFRRR